MQTDRIVRSVLIAVVLSLATVATFGQQSAKGKAAENATLQLLQIHKSYQQASTAQNQQLLSQFTAMAAQRQQLLLSLVQTNPADVLRVAVPNEVRANMPAAVQGYVEHSVTAQGVLEAVMEMQGTPDKPAGMKVHYGLKTAVGRFSVHFATAPPTHLQTGSIVRVNAVQVGAALVLASGTNTSSFGTIAQASASSVGAQSTVVLLVNFQDNQVQPFTVSQVDTTFFTGSPSASSVFQEMSYGQTWLSGNVYGWFTLPINQTCDYNAIASAAQSAATGNGISLGAYAHQVYAFPPVSGCTWYGLGTIGGSPSQAWLQGQPAIAGITHEMGHNLGLYHAHGWDCALSVNCSSGTSVEYGGVYDTMGRGGHYNPFHKEQLRWLNYGSSPPMTTVSASGTYQISSYETQDSAPKALKIAASNGTSYYVRFVRAIGFDAVYSDPSQAWSILGNYNGGIIVEKGTLGSADSSFMLDMTPESQSTSATALIDFMDGALALGRSYTDSAAGVTITPVSISSAGASIQVNLASSGGTTCTNSNPSLTISPPQSSYVVSGTAVNFTVTVKNNDSSSCAPTTFSLGGTLPSWWTGVWSTSALSLSPGTSGTATLIVTSPSGTPDGFYNVSASASNASVTAYSGSATATYVISTPAPVSITLTTDQPSYTAGQTVTITVAMVSGTSPDAGATVAVAITPPSGRSSKQSGTTGSNGTVSFSYKLNKRAPVGSYQVQASTTSTVGAASTMGATTSFSVR